VADGLARALRADRDRRQGHVREAPKLEILYISLNNKHQTLADGGARALRADRHRGEGARCLPSSLALSAVERRANTSDIQGQILALCLKVFKVFIFNERFAPQTASHVPSERTGIAGKAMSAKRLVTLQPNLFLLLYYSRA